MYISIWLSSPFFSNKDIQNLSIHFKIIVISEIACPHWNCIPLHSINCNRYTALHVLYLPKLKASTTYPQKSGNIVVSDGVIRWQHMLELFSVYSGYIHGWRVHTSCVPVSRPTSATTSYWLRLHVHQLGSAERCVFRATNYRLVTV